MFTYFDDSTQWSASYTGLYNAPRPQALESYSFWRKVGKSMFYFFGYLFNGRDGQQCDSGLSPAELDEVRLMKQDLRNSLPNEFVLSGQKYPDLYFRADPAISGKYVAVVDRSILFGHSNSQSE